MLLLVLQTSRGKFTRTRCNHRTNVNKKTRLLSFQDKHKKRRVSEGFKAITDYIKYSRKNDYYVFPSLTFWIVYILPVWAESPCHIKICYHQEDQCELQYFLSAMHFLCLFKGFQWFACHFCIAWAVEKHTTCLNLTKHKIWVLEQ